MPDQTPEMRKLVEEATHRLARVPQYAPWNQRVEGIAQVVNDLVQRAQEAERGRANRLRGALVSLQGARAAVAMDRLAKKGSVSPLVFREHLKALSASSDRADAALVAEDR